jgi:multicomponent Na+:H+ antiporter subunit G
MDWLLHAFTLVALLAGAVFFLAGTVGLLRFPDTLTRLHALTKVDNLGLGLIVLALLPRATGSLMTLKLISSWLLIQLSGAVVTQLLARVALARSSDNGRRG